MWLLTTGECGLWITLSNQSSKRVTRDPSLLLLVNVSLGSVVPGLGSVQASLCEDRQWDRSVMRTTLDT